MRYSTIEPPRLVASADMVGGARGDPQLRAADLIAASRIVEALPSLVAAAAQGIAASNLTILNGTEGVSQVVAGLVGQGFSILDTLKKPTAAASSVNAPLQALPAEVSECRVAA